MKLKQKKCWEIYEVCKKDIIYKHLSPIKYELEINRLTKELGI
jgi:hypothetical protein